MKKALGVFTVLHVIAIVDWVIVLCCAFAFASGGLPFVDAMSNYFVTVGSVFTNISNIGNASVYGTYNYVNLVLFVLAVALTIVWIIVLGVKKKPVYLWFLPLVIIGLFPAICSVGQMDDLINSIVNNGTNPVDLPVIIVNWLLLLLSCISLLFFVVFYILGLVNICRRTPVSEMKEFENVNALADSIPEPTVEEPTVSFDEPMPEPAPTYVQGVEPEGEPSSDSSVKVDDKGNIDAASLARAIRDAVRDIVRDELARAELNKPQQAPAPNNSTITGATFGGPLIVQYFNGGINSVPSPVSEEPKKEEPKPEPEPVKEEVKEEECTCCCHEHVEEEPVPTEEVKEETVVEETVSEEQPVVEEEKVEEPEPVVEDKKEEPVVEEKVEEVKEEPVKEPVVEEPVPEPVKEEPVVEEKPAKVYERISFIDRMIDADKDMQENYNILKNEILSYGVKSRVSNSGDTFRLHKKTYVKITIAGKSLKLYFALDPKDYEDSTMPVQDAGHKGIYAEIPLVFKVRSELSMRRCKDLIQTVMEKDHLEQGEIQDIDWIKDLKAISLEKDKEEKDED